jgi:hypothetical protein
MKLMNGTIQGLWVGSRLSEMERLSISSFIAHGHEYHLYVYEDVKGVPRGTVVKDGNEILPASMIFQYSDFKSYSGFSNFFRYKLLLDRGGWWADTDTVCLKVFDFAEEYVFSSEFSEGKQYVNSGVIKAPARSPAMAFAWRACESKSREQLRWGETGPRLIAEAVKAFSLERFIKPHPVFCPVGYEEWRAALEPGAEWAFDQSTRAIHLWNEMWRRAGQDKDQPYDPACLYEKLKKRYLNQ